MDRFPEIIDPAPIENEENITVEIKDHDDVPIETPKSEEEELVTIQEKPRVDTREVFKNNQSEAPVVQKVKKPKRVISDLQRENLKKAREKALIVRKEKKEKRVAEKLIEKKDYNLFDLWHILFNSPICTSYSY